MFTHVVRFWLKPNTPDAAREALLTDCRELLKQVPGLVHIDAGKPVISPRDVVDNTYDVGLCTIFKSAADHDVYQTHPIHLEFIARNKDHWARVRVVDFQ